ncbi:hypothetical protein [Mycobacterium sp.]|uniref:hypothetical protein n=1 Tax=Mycobacterium sp. TaxID=1785 RepID=UPI002D60CC08|nr:hypothetical protein [Mycobacterium sp.]HZA12341.1 hypothetical protein [Mycobacterium sp.]
MAEDTPVQPQRSQRVDRSGIALVFVLVVLFSYSEEIIAGIVTVAGKPEVSWWRWLVVLFDIVIIAATGLLKRRIAAADGDGNRLWGWWAAGACLALAVDLVLLAVGDVITVWGDLVASTLFVVAMGMLLISALNGDPETVLSPARRRARPPDWIRARSVVPLIVGTYVGYVAAAIWSDVLDTDVMRTLDTAKAAEIFSLPLAEQLPVLAQLCSGAVNPHLFAQMSTVIPLLLVALGIESGYFRSSFREPAQRAATITTVSLLCIGLVLALSAVVKSGNGCGNILTGWHEYLAFVVSVQASAIGLVTLVWLLVVNSRPDDE